MAPLQPEPTLTLYESALHQRLRDYEHALKEGVCRPFIYPWDSLPALWLLLALLIFPRLPKPVVSYVRLPTSILILGHCAYVCVSCRTIGLAGGYGIGLPAMWGCIMTGALLLVHDLKTDFRRLETRPVDRYPETPNESNGSAVSSTHNTQCEDGLRRLGEVTRKSSSATERKGKLVPTYALAWQGYPPALDHSLDWSLDLMTSFCGVNWNFRNPGLPPLDANIPEQSTTSASPNLYQIRLTAIRTFITYYILLDTAKSIGIQDPYFLGLAPLSSSSPYPILQPHPTLTRFFRLLTAVFSVHITLNFIFTLSPLIFPLLPQSITRTPLHHPAMYPSYFSPPFPAISRSSLAGFWGKCWHQLFRFGISQPGIYLTKSFNLPPKSDTARALQLFAAFFLSGCIHASASYTSFPPNQNVTRPLSGPLLFFMLQAAGILLQSLVSRKMNSKSFPVVARKMGNTLYVALWLYFTGPLLADDFARCGVWLFEPVPVSFVRGLRGEGWWKWGGRWAGWSWRDEWWLRGIAIY